MFNFEFNFEFNFSEKKKDKIKNFTELCKKAGYPAPYPKQIKMKEFAFSNKKIPRLILGARGYGKTDYITILGLAEQIYYDSLFCGLIITKEFERGKEIIAEIREILIDLGIELKGKSERRIYTKEAKGKEPTLTNLAVRSKGLRGRHPQIVILEDMITPDDTSEAERLRVQKVYEEVLKLTSNVVLIGQPVHKLDLFQKLRYLIPTLEVKYGDIPQLDADLEGQRASGVSEASISASYFLKIIDDAKLPFTHISLCDYSAQRTVCFIDPSHKGGDYTAVAIGGMHFKNMIVSGFAFKKAWYDCLEEFKFLFEFFGVKSVCFETNNLGDEPVIRMRQLGASCVGKNSTENKHIRIINCAFFSEHIKLQEMKTGLNSEIIQANQIFIQQVREYEYKSKYDDAPDSLAGLMEYLGIMQ